LPAPGAGTRRVPVSTGSRAAIPGHLKPMRNAADFTSPVGARRRVWLLAGCLLAVPPAVASAQAAAADPPASSRAAPPASDPAADRLFARGCARLEAGDDPAAIELLSRAVGKCPDNTEYTLALARAQVAAGQAARAARVLEQAVSRSPRVEGLWVALAELELDQGLCSQVLRRVHAAEQRLGPSGRMQYCAARAYVALGQLLGQTREIRVPAGRPGQFAGDWLLVERRAEPDCFLACPPASALYAIRRALDLGADEPAAQRLHARIWEMIGRPEVGLSILQSREAVELERCPGPTLEALAELALVADRLEEFLRYSRMRAARDPARHDEILYQAWLAAAQRYNQRGDEALYCELLRRALALRSDDVELMRRLGDALWDAGDAAQARIWYRRVLEHDPLHPQRGRLLQRLGG